MSRHTLLDLLGTEQLLPELESRFIDFCIWKQGHPAFVEVLRVTGLDEHATATSEASTIDDFVTCATNAAQNSIRAGLPVLALGAVQGMTQDVQQLAAATSPESGDPAAVSFHAARLVGWAAWARNRFATGMFKTSAEEVAYGEQLQALMELLGARYF